MDKLFLNVFFDLSNVFDLVNYEILFLKLERYGIRDPPFEYINNFRLHQFNGEFHKVQC